MCNQLACLHPCCCSTLLAPKLGGVRLTGFKASWLLAKLPSLQALKPHADKSGRTPVQEKEWRTLAAKRPSKKNKNRFFSLPLCQLLLYNAVTVFSHKPNKSCETGAKLFGSPAKSCGLHSA